MSDAAERQWVREALLALPEKTRNKNLAGSLRRFAEMAEKADETFSLSHRTAKLVTAVFGDSSFPVLTHRSNKAAADARHCQKELAKSIDVVTKNSFEERMIAIKDFAAASSKPVTDVWEKEVSGAIHAYEQVSKVAADRGLPGGRELESKLSDLRSRRSRPPQDDNDARTVALKLARLPQEVATLGLTGKAGEFLVAAAEGRGSPRDLEHPEVRELLDRYALWPSLRVSLGPTR
jgi:hypothetical protein